MNSITLNQGRFDAAIIDLDGTLVDTLGDFVAALNLMLAELLPDLAHATRLDAEVVQRMVGKGSEHLVRAALAHVQRHGSAALDADVALARYQAHYHDINGLHAAVYPGVVEGLQRFRAAGLPMACLTNKPVAFARTLLAAKGLDVFFSEVFGGDSFERKKPDPLPLRKTCEALGTACARTLMLGDSRNDAEAARAAGCPVVLVTYGYNHGEPVHAVDADGFIDALTQLR